MVLLLQHLLTENADWCCLPKGNCVSGQHMVPVLDEIIKCWNSENIISQAVMSLEQARTHAIYTARWTAVGTWLRGAGRHCAPLGAAAAEPARDVMALISASWFQPATFGPKPSKSLDHIFHPWELKGMLEAVREAIWMGQVLPEARTHCPPPVLIEGAVNLQPDARAATSWGWSRNGHRLHKGSFSCFLLFFSCTVRHADLSSLTRDWTHDPAVEVGCLNHWPAREFPRKNLLGREKRYKTGLWQWLHYMKYICYGCTFWHINYTSVQLLKKERRSKEDIQMGWENKHIKRHSTSLVIRETRVRPWRDTDSHPLGRV